jgi:hypothetical protein
VAGFVFGDCLGSLGHRLAVVGGWVAEGKGWIASLRSQ